MSAIRLHGWTTLVALFFALPSWGGEPASESHSAKARVDLYGDPLPKGVLVRLGSVRFRHPWCVEEAVFSPDGKLIAASSHGTNMVVIWERATGRKLHEMRVGGQVGHPPVYLRFSSDGKRLYGSSQEGHGMKFYAWNVATGAAASDVPPFPSFHGGIRTLGYSQDGREMLLLHSDAEIVRWDIEKGKERGRYPKLVKGWLDIVALAGERLLVPYLDDQAVGMWDAVQKKKLWSVKTTRDKDNPVSAMTFSADGKLFAVEAPPKTISLYESVSGKFIRRFKGDVGEGYWTLSISPDARTLTASNRDGSLRLWDMESGRERVKHQMQLGHISNVFFAPDSKTFATGGSSNACAVLLWDTATGKPIDRFPGHVGPVRWLSFSPDGRMAATSSSWCDPVVRLWDARTGRLLRSLASTEPGGVNAVAFSPDGKTLASCDNVDDKVRIWDVRTGRQRYELTGHDGSCMCAAFSPDGKRLASGDSYSNGQYEGRLCIWDAETGKRLHKIYGTRGAIDQVLFTGDGRHILAAAKGIYVYDADSGRLVGKPFQGKTRVWRMALSADGRLLATINHGPARLWELATRREIALATPAVKGRGIALTPDGRILAVGDTLGEVFLLHWPSGQTVGKLWGDTSYIGDQVFFSPDGRRLATADNDECTALIWDVADLVNRPLPAVAKPTEADLRRWWEALRDDNSTEAYKAVWRFVAVPEQTLPFLAASLRPAKPSTPVEVARLIDDLDSDEFQVRERASRQLQKLGDTVEDALRKKRKDNISVEQARRIDQLLAKLAAPEFDREELRATRAVAILEQIGGPEVRKILVNLVAGAAGEQLTLEAQAALERLEKAKR